MSLRRWLPLFLVFALLALASGWLFSLRLGGGDLYPPYSSLRADALGTRAFYEALARIPGLSVGRDYRPVSRLPARPRLVLLPGLEWQGWQTVPADSLAALNAAAASGARVVLAFRADLHREARDAEGRPVRLDEDGQPEEDGAEADDERRERERARRPGARPRTRITLDGAWAVTLKHRWLMAHQPGAERAAEAPADLPAQVAWHSDLYFVPKEGAGWRVLYRRAGEPVAIERAVGRGSVVLLGDAFFLSNEGVHLHRSTGLLSWLVGTQQEVVFLEAPLGVQEETGVGHLVRRHGLHGALALCVLLGLLHVWRQGVAFVPPVEAVGREGEVALAYEPTAGFTALLRRALPPESLLPACVAEWRKTRRAGGAAAATRLEAAWQGRDPRQPLSATYNALVRALKPR